MKKNINKYQEDFFKLDNNANCLLGQIHSKQNVFILITSYLFILISTSRFFIIFVNRGNRNYQNGSYQNDCEMFSDLKNAVLIKEIDTHKNNRLRRTSRIYISRIYLATQIEYI